VDGGGGVGGPGRFLCFQLTGLVRKIGRSESSEKDSMVVAASCGLGAPLTLSEENELRLRRGE